MKQVIELRLGELDNKYYFRQFIFGLIFPILFYVLISQAYIESEIPISVTIFVVVNTLLYPYSRFTYEKFMVFILGENIFTVNVILFLVAKSITMYICWVFAILIAPIGLYYLYYSQPKKEANKTSKTGV